MTCERERNTLRILLCVSAFAMRTWKYKHSKHLRGSSKAFCVLHTKRSVIIGDSNGLTSASKVNHNMADTHCSLLALPPELRNRIWALALPDNRQAITQYNGPVQRAKPPNVMHINRAVRSETLPMYYGTTRFDFGRLGFYRNVRSRNKWLGSIGDEGLSQLRHMVAMSATFTKGPLAGVVYHFTPKGDAYGRIIR